LAREDVDVSQEIRRILSGEGVQVLVETELLQVSGRSGDKITLRVRTPSGEQHIDGTDILVAVGRIPNTAEAGLTEAGVELDGRGYIRVNGRLETSAPDVWAVGECAGSPQFTHIFESYVTTSQEEIAAPAIG
jgi:pyruvate/2-oxoglutarate dehydrogenase complex dihydrolipoamide dehydrogenase (E3) component